ncbi:hypothetical protein BFT35_06130 [Thermoanaerobacterium thermosaccharolyticum]|uniref:Valyl-tRNA synthetase n=2 Tax=Thermoanaerobacterium thermosaccharolyticum TaxID=1517 RepID=A0A231VJV6_THETR|nr:hypothetical protein [Thermoanaerobacterium thermosaccharolyticum]AGB19655.1 hypothetical protein Thethe_02063 [Thermoanaerobacterium thermosaccharolyticum M0795]AST56661.1 Valyl-tRNA synthetase [Thermoanaerobacterium thermosaccharolyticum]MBE0068332.1 hypothetical protein [Thermoanaerobacterium thermosaccharolyticum]MBE0228196.1 hypothetical protein [Thermoanaerobacterium thermosaccharolyticum]OXT08387.1 hypothetical protein CE561_05540 [Thermoanaerobacterium thermosaccharolyticum]
MKIKSIIIFIAGIIVGILLSQVSVKNNDIYVNNSSVATSKNVQNIDMRNPISQKEILRQLKANTAFDMSQIPVVGSDIYGHVWQDLSTKSNSFTSWKIPKIWQKYIYSEADKTDPKSINNGANDKFLYITLQGVVFLYLPPDGRYWCPLPMFGDIPPGSLIIAQHVPLKPAIEAGIIPVYHGQAFTKSYPLPKEWQDALR